MAEGADWVHVERFAETCKFAFLMFVLHVRLKRCARRPLFRGQVLGLEKLHWRRASSAACGAFATRWGTKSTRRSEGPAPRAPRAEHFGFWLRKRKSCFPEVVKHSKRDTILAGNSTRRRSAMWHTCPAGAPRALGFRTVACFRKQQANAPSGGPDAVRKKMCTRHLGSYVGFPVFLFECPAIARQIVVGLSTCMQKQCALTGTSNLLAQPTTLNCIVLCSAMCSKY